MIFFFKTANYWVPSQWNVRFKSSLTRVTWTTPTCDTWQQRFIYTFQSLKDSRVLIALDPLWLSFVVPVGERGGFVFVLHLCEPRFHANGELLLCWQTRWKTQFKRWGIMGVVGGSDVTPDKPGARWSPMDYKSQHALRRQLRTVSSETGKWWGVTGHVW